MKNNIIKINIQNELDIVMAYKRAKQLAEFVGMNISNQTKFSTAVSEICRNVLEHVGQGVINFNIVEQGTMYLEAVVVDHGRGIEGVVELLSSRKNVPLQGKGCGILNSKKLSDFFEIESSPLKGTKVTIRKKILSTQHPINNSIINGWKEYFSKEKALSPYEEIKNQNMQYIELVETLRIKNIEVEDQLHEIKRLNNELDKFAYTVSHDLKAPLNNIEGITDIILEELNNDCKSKAVEGCGMIIDQVYKMGRLINDILSYSKSGKQNLIRKEVDVNILILEVVKSLKKPSGIKIKIADPLPILFTQEILLQQVFTNLLSNAIKYHHLQEGSIEIGCQQKEGIPTFSVKDDGPGIAIADQEKIFRIYEYLPVEGKDGTGVGLSIVKSIVTGKGGDLWVSSDGNSGSQFFFTWRDN